MASLSTCSALDIRRYNKPLLPKYEAAERGVAEKQKAIEAKIAGRRINQASSACFDLLLVARQPPGAAIGSTPWLHVLHVYGPA